MWAGVGWSGSPTLKSRMGSPAAFKAAARCATGPSTRLEAQGPPRQADPRPFAFTSPYAERREEAGALWRRTLGQQSLTMSGNRSRTRTPCGRPFNRDERYGNIYPGILNTVSIRGFSGGS